MSYTLCSWSHSQRYHGETFFQEVKHQSSLLCHRVGTFDGKQVLKDCSGKAKNAQKRRKLKTHRNILLRFKPATNVLKVIFLLSKNCLYCPIRHPKRKLLTLIASTLFLASHTNIRLGQEFARTYMFKKYQIFYKICS